MQVYNIMVIDDEFKDRSSQYHAFFEKTYEEIDITFRIFSIEYGRDIFSELPNCYEKIDAFFIDARLNNNEKGWGDSFGATFNSLLFQIEKLYKDTRVPPIFMLSKHWQDDGGLLTDVNRAFSVFHNPLQASRFYSQRELEAVIQDAQTKDGNGHFRISALRDEREYIKKEILKTRSEKYNSDSPVDVVLQIAVPDEKRRAYQILGLSEENDVYLKKYGFSYQETIFENQHIAIVPQATMGMAEAARIATAAILAFRPRLIAMTGICAGKKGETNLCDLVIANDVFDYSAGKLFHDTMEHRTPHKQITGELNSFVRNILLNRSETIFAQVNEKFQGDAPRGCKIHFASMGSGPWVVDTPKVFDDIREHIVGNCIALDMEAYAVAMAADQMKTPWLVMKSVQDYADGEKQNDEKKSRAYAAFSSTYVLCQQLEKIKEYI